MFLAVREYGSITTLPFYTPLDSNNMEIVSTMGSGSIGRELDLETFVSEVDKYIETPIDANFSSDSMVTIRLEEDGEAYTIFRTGSFQIRGAKNKDRLRETATHFREVLSKIGVEIPNYEFRHVTTVFMEDLGREVNLEVLAIALGMEETEYEPEQFPGLIYRPSEYEVTLLVFATGKIIIGGTTDRDEAIYAVQSIEDELELIS